MFVVALQSSEFLSAVMSGNDVNLMPILMQQITPNVYAAALILSSVTTILIMFFPMRMFSFRRDFAPSGIALSTLLIAFIAAFCGIYSTNIFSEFADLPNLFEADMNGLFGTTLGVLVISVLGPIAEEVVFRASILGHLLRKGINVWVAILTSAFLFGVVHFNPAQIPFAMVIGTILGIIYYRTGNIILTSIIHIANNSLASLMANTLSSDETLINLIGSPVAATISGIVLIALSAYLLYKFWGKTSNIVFNE